MKMIRHAAKILFIVVVALFVLRLAGFPGGQAEAGEIRIAVLLSHTLEPYQKAFGAFQQHLRRQGMSVAYGRHLLEADAGKAGQALRTIKSQEKPNLILALGSLAAESAVNDITDIPIIAGMILRPDSLKKSPNATGVFLDFPVETQLKWIRTFLPKARTLAVLYNPKENGKRVDLAVKAASAMGLKVDAIEINAPADFLPKLNGLGNSPDVIWGMTDGLVFNSLTAKHLLLHSQKHFVPLVGISSAWVKAGALYALEADYGDVGTQCAEMALSILRGTIVSSIEPAPPRKVTYSLNLNAAEQLKIRLSADLVRGASQAY
jgi:putative ABC transport system substrate-binding protein